MCGIFGLIVNKSTACSVADYDKALRLLFRLSEPRGREAAGLALAGGASIDVFKQATSSSDMLASEPYRAYFKAYLDGVASGASGDLSAPLAALGHCRLVTNGSQTEEGNNQPIVLDHMSGVHNGIITNEIFLWSAHAELSKQLDVDTEVLFKLIDQAVSSGRDMAVALENAFSQIEGSASIAFFRDGAQVLALATNTGSLYFAIDAERGFFVFASERYIVQSFLNASPIAKLGGLKVRHLQAGTALTVGFADLEMQSIALPPGVVARASAAPSATRLDVASPVNDERGLRRCTRCLLPHTYPFIHFDDAGVCNYCHDFKPQKFLGLDALERRLAPQRKANGEPDCIIALSGGRDSCYGLHVLKTELGMNPIAYTYDWGLVTDLARRNQARLCGKLGVEHIIRADDLSSKRRYIRDNIEAWLKRPELGMVPIFMAGDKMFFHHARKLRAETGLENVIFCSGNELERCEFKVGFTGIDDTAVSEVLYRYPLWNKVRLALWYGKQYALNPAYFNASFFDSLFSFYSTFVAKEDFVHLYHYVPWDEQRIDVTLKREYDWEGASEADSTWRVGDGYTSFINLIYHTVAGFSEYDTFRSNQVRSGLLTREQGLALAQKDNQPRLESLAEFARVIGFDLDEVLRRIEAIPKLYR